MATENYETAVLVLKQGLKVLDDVLGIRFIQGDSDTSRKRNGHTVNSASLFENASETDLYNQLVLMAGGDQASADRLIAFEQGRFPQETRKESIARAIGKLLKDRRAR